MNASYEYPEIRLVCPRDWIDEYKQDRTVALWNTLHSMWFPTPPHSTRVGTLDLFAQHALMHLLAETAGVQSITWCYLAHVAEADRIRMRSGVPTGPPKPKADSKNASRIAKNWETMRRHMGDADFERLQRAVVCAGFTRFKGEPDLFCFDPHGAGWFFAEAKGSDRLGKSQTNEQGSGWFDISLNTLGEKGRVRVYRVVAER